MKIVKSLILPALALPVLSCSCTCGFSGKENKIMNEQSAGMVNVLELGIKNDGSVDISEIVNRETANHSLFFPAGFYKVEKPIYLKNSICGVGYCRNATKSATDTWFISALNAADSSVGVINYLEGARLNVENLNIDCSGQECGIRIDGASQATMTLVDKVGIYQVKGYGIYIQGGGSRPVFLQNITVFGSKDYPVPGVGIYCTNWDNRFMNIEIMGCRIGLELLGGPTYGSNLHLWTGCMSGKDNGTWWRGTRGILLHGTTFIGSQVYPDTCFYALEQTAPKGGFFIQNIMYWEDTNTKTSPDFDGAFFHCTGDFKGDLQIDGGYIAVMERVGTNGRMQNVYMAGQRIRNVLLRTDLPLCIENLHKLCLCDTLPDYTLEYKEKGFCKAADLFTAAESGYVEANLSTDNGACWLLTFTKLPGGKTEIAVKPLNPLCKGCNIRTAETADGILSVYVENESAKPLSIRFTTKSMCREFRPVDYGYLRNCHNEDRAHEVREAL